MNDCIFYLNTSKIQESLELEAHVNVFAVTIIDQD